MVHYKLCAARRDNKNIGLNIFIIFAIKMFYMNKDSRGDCNKLFLFVLYRFQTLGMKL